MIWAWWSVVGVLLASCAVGPRPTPSVANPCRDQLAHAIQTGETLYRIALQYGLKPDELARANHVEDARRIHAGQLLCIPSSTSGDEATLAQEHGRRPEGEEAESHAALLEAYARAQHAPVPQGELAAATLHPRLNWPLRGIVYGRFGKRGGEVHDGIDLAAPAGTPIQAAGPGRVLFAGEQKGYGLLLIVEHAPGLVTVYAHNRDLRVHDGQEVRERQVVATVGESGHTTGPHLHFEVRMNGIAVDPMPYLGPPPQKEDRHPQ